LFEDAAWAEVAEWFDVRYEIALGMVSIVRKREIIHRRIEQSRDAAPSPQPRPHLDYCPRRLRKTQAEAYPGNPVSPSERDFRTSHVAAAMIFGSALISCP
jgi:hypothetical protein